MAGERLFRTFDAPRYEGVLPGLDELRATRAPSANAYALLASLVAPAPEGAMRRGHEALARIVRHPALAPRVFLSPKQISSAIEFVVERTCFEHDGQWSLTERGASWAVLDSCLIVLHDDPWFDELLNADRPGVWHAPYPRGEAAFRVISLELLGELVERLRAILDLDPEGLPSQIVAFVSRRPGDAHLHLRQPLPEGLGIQIVRAELGELFALATRARGHARALATSILL